jgi:hypothetical protein
LKACVAYPIRSYDYASILKADGVITIKQ